MSDGLIVLTRIAASLVIGVSVNGAAEAQHLNPSELFELASPSVVIVEALGKTESQSAQGSGVVIARGVVITNCHVLKPQSLIRVKTDLTVVVATVRARSDSEDLCALDVAGLNLPAVKIRNSDSLKVGERVFAIGAPRGLELSLSDGLLSSIRRSKAGRLIQTTAPISPGSSGGGLFDTSGRLIGITTMFLKESQQLNFAVPAERAARLKDGGGAPTSSAAASEIEKARAQLVAFDQNMIRQDSKYLSRRDELDQIVYKIRQTLPPSQWLTATKAAYSSLTSPKPQGGNYEERVDKARAQLSEYDAFMMENDSAYGSKRDALSELVYEIRKSRPPEEWLEATRNAYRGMIGGAGHVSGRKQATASRWVKIFQNEEQSIELDTRLESVQEGGVIGWTKWIYDKPTTIGKEERVKTTLNQWHFNCASRKAALLGAVVYDQVGDVIRRIEVERPTFDKVIPDSLGELEWQKACDVP